MPKKCTKSKKKGAKAERGVVLLSSPVKQLLHTGAHLVRKAIRNAMESFECAAELQLNLDEYISYRFGENEWLGGVSIEMTLDFRRVINRPEDFSFFYQEMSDRAHSYDKNGLRVVSCVVASEIGERHLLSIMRRAVLLIRFPDSVFHRNDQISISIEEYDNEGTMVGLGERLRYFMFGS